MTILNGFVQRNVFLATLIVFLTGFLPGYGQQVKESSETINSRKYEGFSLRLDATSSIGEDFWREYLGEDTRVRKKRDFFQVDGLKLPGQYYPEAIYYSRLTSIDSITTKIWISLDPESLVGGEDAQEQVNTALKEFMDQSVPEFERFSIRKAIEEAQSARAYTEKQQRSHKASARNLAFDLTEAEQEFKTLSDRLSALELEILTIRQKIEDANAAAVQDSLDILKIDGVIDKHQTDLKKIN